MDMTSIISTQPPSIPTKQNTDNVNTESYEYKARETADEFESFYIYQMLELMQPEKDKDSILGGGFAEEMFQHTLNEHLAEELTGQGGIGIADNIYESLIKLQEIK